MGVAQPKEKISIAEYLKIESESDFKYEYHDGEVFAMAGGTIAHAFITGYVHGAIDSELEKKNSNCQALNSEAKIYIKAINCFVYPDTTVVCNELEKSKEGNGICNPTLIVEVLSKSTEGYDRGDKFTKYRKISSLQEYVLIEQDRPKVEVFYKPLNTDLWRILTYEGLENIVRLESIDLDIPMSRIYRKILEQKN